LACTHALLKVDHLDDQCEFSFFQECAACGPLDHCSEGILPPSVGYQSRTVFSAHRIASYHRESDCLTRHCHCMQQSYVSSCTASGTFCPPNDPNHLRLPWSFTELPQSNQCDKNSLMAALRPLSHSQPPTTPLPVVHRVIFPFLRLVCPRAQLLGLVRERQHLKLIFVMLLRERHAAARVRVPSCEKKRWKNYNTYTRRGLRRSFDVIDGSVLFIGRKSQ